MEKHSVSIRGHRTSLSLETEFWNAMKEIAEARAISVAHLVTEIDASRDPGTNLSSALRLYVLSDLQGKLGRH